MGRPKLQEEEVKVPVPLRLSKDAIARLDEIAEAWGEAIGKEVKRATVAREMVLIGLSVFMTLKYQRIFAEFKQEVSDPEDRQLRLVGISAAADDLFTESSDRNIDSELTEKAIMESLKTAKEALLNGRIPAGRPSPGLNKPEPIIPLHGSSHKKGGKS